MKKILFFPFLRNRPLIIRYKDKTTNIFSKDGYFNFVDLKLNIIPDDDFFSIEENGREIMHINFKYITEAKTNLRLIRGTTCLGIDKDNFGCLYPLQETYFFSINDRYIVIFLELDGIKHDIPIIISIYDDDLLYSVLNIIPESKNYEGNFHRTYAHGIELDNENIKSNIVLNCNNTKKLTLSVHLITGELIYVNDIVIGGLVKKDKYYRQLIPNRNGINFDTTF